MARSKKSSLVPGELTATDIEVAARTTLPPDEALARYDIVGRLSESAPLEAATEPDARAKAVDYLKGLLVNAAIYIGGQLEAATILIDNGITDGDVLKYLTELMEGAGREHADRRRAAALIFKLVARRNRDAMGLA